MTPDSILESLLNPGTAIKQGFETVVVRLRDGSIVSGLLQRKTESDTIVRELTGSVRQIPNGEIEGLDASPVSLMPAGLTAGLRRRESERRPARALSLPGEAPTWRSG